MLMLQQSPLAYNVYCVSYCLNCVLHDATQCFPVAAMFFGVIQKLYTFLSSDSICWNFFLETGDKDKRVVKWLCPT